MRSAQPSTSNRGERRRQTVDGVKNDKTDAKQTNRVHADKQPQRHPVKSVAQ